MPPILGALWSLFGLLRPFQRLRLAWQFLVVVLVLSLLGTGWWVAFYMRLSAHRHKTQNEHLRLMALDAKCQRDKDMRLLMPKECEAARHEAAHDFDSVTWWFIWETSFVCGGTSCWDVVFGSDSSTITLSLRLAVVGVILATALLVINALRRCLFESDKKIRTFAARQWVDRFHDADRMPVYHSGVPVAEYHDQGGGGEEDETEDQGRGGGVGYPYPPSSSGPLLLSATLPMEASQVQQRGRSSARIAVYQQ
jgi:hypothetical protein